MNEAASGRRQDMGKAASSSVLTALATWRYPWAALMSARQLPLPTPPTPH